LFLVLSTTRRGMDFNADETMGPAIRTIQIGGGSFKVFVDSWGTPIKYMRWPKPDATLNKALMDEMNDPRHPEYSPVGKAFKDPDDPEGLLLPTGPLPGGNPNNTWPASIRLSAAARLLGFPPGSTTPYDFPNLTLLPTAISAGPDKQFGFQGTGTYQTDTGDDIFSFRMRRERQRGE